MFIQRWLFNTLIFMALIAGSVAFAADRKEIPLVVTETPADLWSKRRFAVENLDTGLRLYDVKEGPFNDASLWQLKFGQDLPYGRKFLSFDVTVAEDHKPLWGTSLLQPIIDGKEANAALDASGKPSFEKSIAPDGKGFVTIPSDGKTTTITLDIPKSATRLSTFAFMTAGAENFDMTLSDFKVVAWPEIDDRVFPHNPVATSMGFPPNHPQSVFIEWFGYEPDREDAPDSATVVLDGPDGQSEINVSLPRTRSTASGSAVSRLNLDLPPGKYKLSVPKLGERSSSASTSFEVRKSAAALMQMRDDAWGAFYWITGGPNGPFPDAHPQDKQAKVFGGGRAAIFLADGMMPETTANIQSTARGRFR